MSKISVSISTISGAAAAICWAAGACVGRDVDSLASPRALRYNLLLCPDC